MSKMSEYFDGECNFFGDDLIELFEQKLNEIVRKNPADRHVRPNLNPDEILIEENEYVIRGLKEKNEILSEMVNILSQEADEKEKLFQKKLNQVVIKGSEREKILGQIIQSYKDQIVELVKEREVAEKVEIEIKHENALLQAELERISSEMSSASNFGEDCNNSKEVIQEIQSYSCSLPENRIIEDLETQIMKSEIAKLIEENVALQSKSSARTTPVKHHLVESKHLWTKFNENFDSSEEVQSKVNVRRWLKEQEDLEMIQVVRKKSREFLVRLASVKKSQEELNSKIAFDLKSQILKQKCSSSSKSLSRIGFNSYDDFESSEVNYMDNNDRQNLQKILRVSVSEPILHN